MASNNQGGATRLPKNKEEWEKRFPAGSKAKSITEIKTLNSGSSVTEEQFLTFRVLWTTKSCACLYIPKAYERDANAILDRIAPFKSYIEHIKQGNKGVPSYTNGGDKLGVFQMVRYYQLQVQTNLPAQETQDDSMSQNVRFTPVRATPSSSDGSASASALSNMTAACDQTWIDWKPASDEQIVNQALMKLLTALTINIPNVKCEWSIARFLFKHQFKHTTMEARTDGYLRLLQDNGRTVIAIVETKAHVRRDNRVRMQEAAEMLLWILHNHEQDPGIPAKKRYLIAQDRHEIFVVKAEYDLNYIEYLRNKERDTFMRITEFGPFKTDESQHMKKFANFIVALCLQIGE
ncbi:hypothetical protein C8Q69DRAFT_530597 [Paecilomyces variotii]|uniref:Uncharacterized protein n=1 Tax=Byssochlamys spectabilis TaxID=264951 RepID=A0A443HKR3_BYSSP|nr:hypothetical protein C8Q69DRAFT_530597 [Paecilomyces variotii]KAJ9355344.1 hypothetical protein DTO280E4_6559 [Paecilomyces variotii]RWQ92398.1 hypothetical protein C8Q69DRAFT_530597 [Paecilomyces variotii]